jgi:hypothetical protein
MYQLMCYGSVILCETPAEVLAIIRAVSDKPPNEPRKKKSTNNLLLDTDASTA